MSLDDEVLKFFPDDAPAAASANLKAMRVRDLLRMATGNQTEAPLLTQNAPWTKTFLAQPVPFKPGTHFLYNSPATYMLSAIVQKVTGMTVLDYLKPRLFEPLGIENPTLGRQSAGNLGRCLRSLAAHGRHRPLRTVVSAERKVERQTTSPVAVGRRGHRQADRERLFAKQ